MGSHIWTLAQNTINLIMKFLVLAAFVAADSAQTLVTYPNGAQVPADTPEVAAAKLAHAAAGGLVNPIAYAGYPFAGYPYPYAVGFPELSLLTLTEPLSPLTLLRSTPPRLPMPLLVELSTPWDTTASPTPPDSSLTPTVPSSLWSPLMSRPPELNIWPLTPALT